MTTLQLIIKKAKALRKAAPKKYSKWTDYVKAASATIKPKKKATVTGVKKKVVKKAAPKKLVRKKAAPKKTTSVHKDSKSHNVRINVVSGIGNIGENFTRVNNDVNGNPRYVIHFLDILNDEERINIPFTKKYEYAVKKAKKIGGKKYDNKSYGGGIVFQSYSLPKTWDDIQKLKNTTPKIKY